MIYFFCVEIIILILFLFACTSGDVLAPPLIVCYVFLISTLCVIYNQAYWQFTMNFTTFIFLSLGLWIFSLVAIVVIGISQRCILRMQVKKEDIAYIKIDEWRIICVIVYDLIFSVYYLKKILDIMQKYTSSRNWYYMMKQYRNISAYGILSGEDALPFLAVYSFRLIEVFGYIFLYIWINNYFAEDKKKTNQRLLLVPIIIYLISGVLSSGRMYILQYSGGAVMCFYILWHRKYGWNKFIGFKFVGRIILAFVGILIVFTAMGS